MVEEPVNDSLQLTRDLTEVKTTLGHMSANMSQIADDVKDLREGAPLHRIEKLETGLDSIKSADPISRIDKLEGRWRGTFAWLGSLSLIIIGAFVTYFLAGR